MMLKRGLKQRQKPISCTITRKRIQWLLLGTLILITLIALATLYTALLKAYHMFCPNQAHYENIITYRGSEYEKIANTPAQSLSSSPQWNISTVIQAVSQLTFQEQMIVFDVVNGKEFPYPLTCPKDIISSEGHPIVLAYHVGLINNWRLVVKDQMRTVDSCGLGSVVSKMFVTYSSNNTENTPEELQQIIRRYSVSSKVTFLHSPDYPVEATAMRTVRDYCRGQEKTENKLVKKDAIVFYFHSKGTSRYSPLWRDQESELRKRDRKKTVSYKRVLYWRKYMEYFMLERPELCIDKILHHGAKACGVHEYYNTMKFKDTPYVDPHFAGNFWAASCDYLKTLPNIEEYLPGADKWQVEHKAEFWIGANLTISKNNNSFVSLFAAYHKDLYWNFLYPSEYSDYSYRWGV